MGSLLGQGFPVIAAAAGSGEGHHVGFLGVFVYFAFVLLLIFGFLAYAKTGLKTKVFTNPITAASEQLFLFVQGMCVNVIGSHGRKYVPFIGTLWLVIFVGNLVALFTPFSPTADLSFNLAMAVISVSYVQYEGIQANGLWGHLKHFSGPKLGGFLAVVISPVIFCIEIISELMKNVSLSLRLYGNIHGGHQAVSEMNKLGAAYYVPWGELLIPIKLLTVVVQALIFTLLTCVYLSLVTSHEGHEEEESGHSSADMVTT